MKIEYAISKHEYPTFINKCGCIYDEISLRKALINECKLRNKKIKKTYVISLRNQYGTICIAHDHVYVHSLIGKFIYGDIKKGYVIHHKDFNKLNNSNNNLEYMSSLEHYRLHANLRKGIDLRCEEGKWKGINAARDKKYRHDITKEKIKELLDCGYTKKEIALKLNCGINTILRRLAPE